MKRALPLILLISMVVVVACGGGSPTSNRSGGGGSTISASFDSASPTPTGPNEISMDQGSVNANVVTVRVRITDTDDVYGASFELDYDAGAASFEGWSPGTILEQGNTPNYVVTDPGQANGTIVVSASRTGSVSGVNVNGTQTLINLTFRVTDAGTMPVQLLNEELYDNQLPPQPLPGPLTWSTGSLVGVEN